MKTKELDRKFYNGIAWAIEEMAMYGNGRDDEFHSVGKTLWNSLGKEEQTLLRDLMRKNNPEIYKDIVSPFLRKK